MQSKRSLSIAAPLALAALVAASGAHAQISGGVVKIGVMSDMSSLYSDIGGAGSVVAARMAVEDYGKMHKGLKVEIVSADHLNKPDVGSSIARQWYDVDGVDVIVDVPTSSVALAINQITREKGKAFLVSGAASSDLTGKACSPNTIHWTYDTWMLANGTGNAIVKTGGDTWFFITADYAFGLALERDTEAVVLKNGGKVLGRVRVPLNNQDFSSFLLQAQASKAKIIGLANAGGDTTNAIKQAAEFGIVKGGQNLAGLLVFLSDVHGLGLDKAQGLIFTETFYWDLNNGTRAFAKRFAALNNGKYPTMVQAGVYSAILHYLKAVAAGKTDDGTKTVAKMKEMPTDDPLFGKGHIRIDGRKIHPA
ncbi:MAG TPA: ABC transporter substrate-binding protein, partial [Burkholderiales bacterium]|nr:ABC transporter substrate-binding protein [Burkholderiales bacterium]